MSYFGTCKCTGPGYCQRHGINKNAAWVRLCRTDKKYWDAWEKGTGPGQNIVARTVEVIWSGVGDILARRFSALGIVPVPGCPCKDVQHKLNGMSIPAIESDVNGWASRLQRSAKKWKELKGGAWAFIPTPPMWLCRRVLEDAIREAKGQITADVPTSKDEATDTV